MKPDVRARQADHAAMAMAGLEQRPHGEMPLLRAPPFPGSDASISRNRTLPLDFQPDDVMLDRVFAAMRDARVGGAFWAPPSPDAGCTSVRRDAPIDPPAAGRTVARPAAICLSPGAHVDPWSLLGPDVHLTAHGNDEWVAIAHIAGATVELLSSGIYGDPGATPANLRRRIGARLFAAAYRDPFDGQDIDIAAAIDQLALWRRVGDANRDIVAACGIAWWKRPEIRRFLWSPHRELRFFRSERRAIAHAARVGGAIAIWPSRISPTMTQDAAAADVPLIRVEDGFVRSIGLGSDMVPPSSITVDRRGIHYDPNRPSDLETLLATEQWSPAMLARARALRDRIVAAQISKYGDEGGSAFPVRRPGRRLVLVPGQVSDDMSVRLGGGGLTSNLDLLRRARALEPDAEIWFRPHPDVDAGHRKGAIADEDALTIADHVVRGGSMAQLLDLVDAVHVLTSLTGFEALLRGCDVTCHGTPFYAGWGLTRALTPVPARRGRILTLDQLVAGVLILYPRYLDPVTALPCSSETLIGRMSSGRVPNRLRWVSRVRRLQGRLRKALGV